MSYKKLSKSYNKTCIETAGKLDLVIMCYEKVIQCLKQARDHFINQEIEQKAIKLQKALDIINELQSCLNLEKGGQIARNLDSIYTYLSKRILLGDIHGDITAFDEGIRILTELKDAWDQVATECKEPIDPAKTHNMAGTGAAQIAA